MKKLIFFDLDNTIYSNQNKAIPENTLRLIKYLGQSEDVILGLATGRGPHKVKMLDDIIHLFKYRVFMNGAIAFSGNKIIYENKMKIKDIEQVMASAIKHDVTVGFVAADKEVLTRLDKNVELGLKGYYSETPEVNPNVYKEKDIFQIWLFASDIEKINQVALENYNLERYDWHKGGADLVNKNTNKVEPIKKIKAKEKPDQLICVGDGQNDILMVDYADIGIAMDNSKFESLKEKADYVAPHIDLDQMIEVFKDLKIIAKDAL